MSPQPSPSRHAPIPYTQQSHVNRVSQHLPREDDAASDNSMYVLPGTPHQASPRRPFSYNSSETPVSPYKNHNRGYYTDDQRNYQIDGYEEEESTDENFNNNNTARPTPLPRYSGVSRFAPNYTNPVGNSVQSRMKAARSMETLSSSKKKSDRPVGSIGPNGRAGSPGRSIDSLHQRNDEVSPSGFNREDSLEGLRSYFTDEDIQGFSEATRRILFGSNRGGTVGRSGRGQADVYTDDEVRRRERMGKGGGTGRAGHVNGDWKEERDRQVRKRESMRNMIRAKVKERDFENF
jgi:hypothetical protein